MKSTKKRTSSTFLWLLALDLYYFFQLKATQFIAKELSTSSSYLVRTYLPRYSKKISTLSYTWKRKKRIIFPKKRKKRPRKITFSCKNHIRRWEKKKIYFLRSQEIAICISTFTKLRLVILQLDFFYLLTLNKKS